MEDYGQLKVYSVSELTSQIRFILEREFPYLWVEAEVSNVKLPKSGHMYFTLKDKTSQLKAVMFYSFRQHMKFDLKDGMSVLCFGRISVYARDGTYQLYVEEIQPKGIGALQLAFLQLKEKLEKEGLFKTEFKKQIPFLPRVVGVITSATGAAVRDIIKVIHRRFPSVDILIYPVKVQGSDSAKEISEAIYNMNKYFKEEVDVLIVGRGGGSIEDLWAFNEEIVARAIFESDIPVISAVGHEIDWTISDFVADLRAPTPSAAAELAVPNRKDLISKLEHLIIRLKRYLKHKFDSIIWRLHRVRSSRVFFEPKYKIQQYMQQLDELIEKAYRVVVQKKDISALQLSNLAVKLEILNPFKTLTRGYSVVYRVTDNKLVSSVSMVKKGIGIKVLVSDGSFYAIVVNNDKKGKIKNGQEIQAKLF